MTTIDTPEGIEVAGLLALAHRLALEINTGMGSRVSSLGIARRRGLTTKRTKKGALEDVVAAIKDKWPGYEPRSTVARALGKEG